MGMEANMLIKRTRLWVSNAGVRHLTSRPTVAPLERVAAGAKGGRSRGSAAALIVLGALMLASCASYKATQVDLKPVGEYGHRATADGITLAADPYDDPERAKATFDEDIRKKGYVPIQLVIDNKTNGRLLVQRQRVELIAPSGETYRPVASAIMSQDFEDDKIAYAFLGGLLSYASAEEANKKREADWATKGVPDSMFIEPDKTGGGFVYFHLPEGRLLGGSSLRTSVENLDTKQTTELRTQF